MKTHLAKLIRARAKKLLFRLALELAALVAEAFMEGTSAVGVGKLLMMTIIYATFVNFEFFVFCQRIINSPSFFMQAV